MAMNPIPSLLSAPLIVYEVDAHKSTHSRRVIFNTHGHLFETKRNACSSAYPSGFMQMTPVRFHFLNSVLCLEVFFFFCFHIVERTCLVYGPRGQCAGCACVRVRTQIVWIRFRPPAVDERRVLIVISDVFIDSDKVDGIGETGTNKWKKKKPTRNTDLQTYAARWNPSFRSRHFV